jgi:hypothetical protein
MNTHTHKTQLTKCRASYLMILLAGLPSAVSAETADQPAADATVTPAKSAPAGSAISGSLNLDCNSHFISYGADVWGTGDTWNDMMVHPSLNLSMNLSDDFYAFVGTWLDINNITTSRIGSTIQEIDAWVGVGKKCGKWDLKTTYQEWTYGGDVERILDIGVSYDTFLHPSITIHNRIDGNGSQKTGTVGVFGISEGFDYQGLTTNMCASIAFNTDEFHGGDSGMTFVSVGPQFTYPLSNISQAYGNWALHGGLTYYYTPTSTCPGNPTDSFLTGSVGVGVNF